MGRISCTIGALAAGGLWAAPAAAQEYCVSCTEPSALYRCVIDGARPGGPSLQLLCVQAMARDGRHATCGVKRGTVFECDGAVKRVPWSAGAAPPGADPSSPPPQVAAQPPPDAPKAGPKEPPKTMVDLAKQANENMKESMRTTGENLSNATKKTWECLTSFFKRC